MARLRLLDLARSVRARIVVSILVVAALGMTAAALVTIFVQRERTLAQIDERLAHTAADISAAAHGGDDDGRIPTSTRELLTIAMARIVPDHNESTIAFIDGRAALVPAADVPFRLDEQSAFLDRITDQADDAKVVMGTTDTDVGTLRYAIVPVSVAGDDAKGLYVAAYNVSAELAEVRDAFLTYAAVAAASLVVMGLVGWFVAGRSLAPLRRLGQTAARISGSDLSERIPDTGNDDVSDLAHTFNSMLDRLESSFTAQNRLLDDVSHELKTPLTIVRGHLELMDPLDAGEVATTRDIAIDELDRMNTLVIDIGLLVKSSHPGFIRPALTDVGDLTELVQQKAAMLSGTHAWLLGEVAEITASLDAARITQAWLALADNAAKYSPTFTPIEIGSAVVRGDGGTELQLWVLDEGRGISLDAQQKIFQRFARVQEGRGVEGSGLGLAIVATIAAGHGGRVSVESAPGQGSRFVIHVPVSEDSTPADAEDDTAGLTRSASR